MLPGMAKTSRPCFNAKPAVINAPLRSGASQYRAFPSMALQADADKAQKRGAKETEKIGQKCTATEVILAV